MAVTSAFADFFKAIGELFISFFRTFAHLIQTIFNTITGFITGIVSLVATTIGNVFQIFGETGKFIFGNAVVLLLVVGGALYYLNLRKQQGRPVTVGNKKLE